MNYKLSNLILTSKLNLNGNIRKYFYQLFILMKYGLSLL